MKAEGAKGKEAMSPRLATHNGQLATSPIKNGRRERRPGYRRHKAGTAYGCFVSDLTRFAADPCIGPGRLWRRPLCSSTAGHCTPGYPVHANGVSRPITKRADALLNFAGRVS